MFCMAIWLSGSVFISVIATQNFYTIDRLIDKSPNDVFRVVVETMENPQARDLLRYLSSELNRLYFQYWNLAQLPVGIIAISDCHGSSSGSICRVRKVDAATFHSRAAG